MNTNCNTRVAGLAGLASPSKLLRGTYHPDSGTTKKKELVHGKNDGIVKSNAPDYPHSAGDKIFEYPEYSNFNAKVCWSINQGPLR